MKPPSRLSETAFRRYEEIIQAVIYRWPKPVVVLPQNYGLSPATVEARLRDAISVMTKYSQLQAPDEIVVRRLDDGSIIAGSREATKQAKEIVVQPAGPQPTMVILDSEWELLEPAVRLLAAKKISGPILVHGCEVSLDILEKENEITRINNLDGTSTLL